MWMVNIVINKPSVHPFVQVGAGLEIVQLNVRVRERPPQPLDEGVVHPAATTIHTDLDIGGLQHAYERETGELTALIGVENPWLG